MNNSLRSLVAAVLAAWLLFCPDTMLAAPQQDLPPAVPAPTPPPSPFPRTLDQDAELVLSKAETDGFVYEQVLLHHVNSRKDYTTLMKMEVLANLAASHPNTSSAELIKVVNDFEAKLEAKQAEAATGRDARWDTGLQALKDAADVAQAMPQLKKLGVAAHLAHTYADVGLRYYNAFTAADRRAGAQQSVASEVERARRLREDVVSRFHQAQRDNPKVRGAAKTLIDPVVDAAPDQSAKTLLANNPAAAMSFTVQGMDQKLDEAAKNFGAFRKFVTDHMKADGALTVRMVELYEQNAADLQILKTGLKQVSGSIASMHKSQTVMFNYLLQKDRAEEEAAKARRVAEEEAAVRQITNHGLRSSARLITMLLHTADPKAATHFATVSQAALDISETLQQYEKTMKLIEAMDRTRDGLEMAKVMGTAMMAAGVLGAGLAVLSMFADSGPSADQMILEQLAAISQQIQDLRTEMHDRFDRVDRRLTQVLETLTDGFNAVLANQRATLDRLDEVRTQLTAMTQKLNELSSATRLIDQRIAALGEDVFEFFRTSQLDECIGLSDVVANPVMSRDTLQRCYVQLLRIATDTSTAATLTGGPVDASEALDPVSTARRLADPTAKNLRFLHRVALEPEYRIPALENVTTARLPNLMYWSSGSQAIHDLLYRWPAESAALGIRVDNIAPRLRAPGDEARRFLRSITGDEFVKLLLAAYERSLTAAVGEEGLERLWRNTVREVVEKETIAAADFETLGLRRIKACGDAANDARYPEIAMTEALAKRIPERVKELVHLGGAVAEMCYVPVLRSSDRYYEARTERTNCKRERVVGGNCREVECSTECVEWETVQHPPRCIGNVAVALNLSLKTRRTSSGSHTRSPWLKETIVLDQLPGKKLCEGYDGSASLVGWLQGRPGAVQTAAEETVFTEYRELDPAIRGRIVEIADRVQQAFAARVAATVDGSNPDPALRERITALSYRQAALEAFLRAGFLHGIARHDLLRAALYGSAPLPKGEGLAAAAVASLEAGRERVPAGIDLNAPATRDAVVGLLVPDRSPTVLSPFLAAALEAQRAKLDTFRTALLENLPALREAEPLGPSLVLEEIDLMAATHR